MGFELMSRTQILAELISERRKKDVLAKREVRIQQRRFYLWGSRVTTCLEVIGRVLVERKN